MFRKKNKQQNEQKAGSINIIGDCTEIKGNLSTKGDVRVDGEIEGEVISHAKVVVGISGKVLGNIQAYAAEISGKVLGNIEVADILFIKATAKVEGNISSNKLIIENGADLDGFCQTGQTDIKSISYGKERARKKEEIA